jgi:hypothetical protein
MLVFASPCYKPQNARPGSGRRTKPVTSNLGSWGTTVPVPWDLNQGRYPVVVCYHPATRTPRTKRIQEDIELCRIALVCSAWVSLGSLSTWFRATLNQQVLPTLRPSIANGKHWQVPDRDIVAVIT